MERGGTNRAVAGASLVLAVLLLPAAAADTTMPVQGDAEADYEADAGAILAQLRGYDPRFTFSFTFERAALYELLIPPATGEATKGALVERPQVPTVLNVRHLQAGSVLLDSEQGPALLLFNDPRGLSLESLPVGMPRDPARFVVEGVPLGSLDTVPQLDPHDLTVAGSLHYALDGLLTQQPLRASAEGDLLALFAEGPVRLTDGRNTYARDLATEPQGQRVLLVQAEGALATIEGTGTTAVLAFPEAGLGASGQLVADLAGREVGARPNAELQSTPQGLDVASGTNLGLHLLEPRGFDPVTGSSADSQGASYVPLDARTAAAGALIGTAVALAAAGLAALLASGKYGLFGLLAPLYARLHSDEVLANHTREAIYRHVVENPGVNVSEVVKRFGLGWGATVYHLRVLERTHLLVGSKQGRQVCYFQNGGRYHGQMAGISALRNENAALVARTILEHPGAQQRELCRLTGLAQPTVSWHLQRLEEAALVQAEGAPRKRYTALGALQQLAERGLLQGIPPPAAPSPPAPPTQASAA